MILAVGSFYSIPCEVVRSHRSANAALHLEVQVERVERVVLQVAAAGPRLCLSDADAQGSDLSIALMGSPPVEVSGYKSCCKQVTLAASARRGSRQWNRIESAWVALASQTKEVFHD
jgi:hypothetical protein